MTTSKSRRKGYIVLSMGRSGTTWLKSINNATGRMGITDEWLGFETLGKPLRTYNAQSYYEQVMQRASTPNGRFSMKIFPRHLRLAQAQFGFDFIKKCAQENDVKFFLVTREDRFGQAISALKAQQSRSWVDDGGTMLDHRRRKIRYNFRKLCELYFEIGSGYNFWRSYLGINSLDYESFVYETLLPNPAPFFESAAKHLGVAQPESYESPMVIQRNAETEEWRQRFQEDIATQGVHPDTYNVQQPDANLLNALKVLAQKPIKPATGRL
ncbi:MAG: hypothetical protein COB08_000490 [Rhodobacteraceae bacterium]|nr:hypothetical protein [Paracoccaceae bacterium]